MNMNQIQQLMAMAGQRGLERKVFVRFRAGMLFQNGKCVEPMMPCSLSHDLAATLLQAQR